MRRSFEPVDDLEMRRWESGEKCFFQALVR